VVLNKIVAFCYYPIISLYCPAWISQRLECRKFREDKNLLIINMVARNMDLLRRQKRMVTFSTNRSIHRGACAEIRARMYRVCDGVVTFSTKRHGRNFSGSFRQIGDFCCDGNLVPYTIMVGKRKPPVGAVAGWRRFGLWAIRCLVLQVLVAYFLKFQLADNADVVTVGTERFYLGEFGRADLVAHDEHLHCA